MKDRMLHSAKLEALNDLFDFSIGQEVFTIDQYRTSELCPTCKGYGHVNAKFKGRTVKGICPDCGSVGRTDITKYKVVAGIVTHRSIKYKDNERPMPSAVNKVKLLIKDCVVSYDVAMLSPTYKLVSRNLLESLLFATREEADEKAKCLGYIKEENTK